ncbi:succinate dehydrogenase/fumarate reductase cytochrome b subunit [Caldalkalibacillus uzonensis]|uniref:Succinate dehydrogenase/fumarate reductase cytochrome b subunit n=1 Tax=Caldalkalibacillus uzonensis TaxID=353224 RepID=A0ABU0CNI4_9BACI|nr:hypothetical protein [Caldalkalibacillus uzonensis]MDQ0337964.1 succinate dehydrogenase/fumarate reductase cytochrome b subunit [Caldalkalibacillus uzonensis]
MVSPRSRTSVETGREFKISQKPFVGYIAWLIQRITALMLLILLPLKIYSGYAMIGKLPGGSVIAALHISPLIDAILLFAVIFHALYGIRVMCIDIGWVKDNRDVFMSFTIIGTFLFALSFFFMVL